MAATKQITFTVSEQTLKEIEKLKAEFDVETSAAVIRRALALARVATDNAGGDYTLTIMNKDKEQQKIMLRG